MEYIREELLRQQAALGRLLLGAPAPEEETAPGREAPARDGAPGGAASPGAGERPETAPAARTAAASPRARAGHGGDVPGAEGPERDGPGFGEAWGEAPPPTAGRGAGEDRQPLPAASGWGWAPPAGRGPDWTGAPGEGAAVLVTEVARPAPREGGGARELSRVFQRDARRYDGGFRLY